MANEKLNWDCYPEHLRPSEPPEPATVFSCGPSTQTCKCECPNGPCEHQFDGPEIDIGQNGSSATCSKCGMPALDHDMWVL